MTEQGQTGSGHPQLTEQKLKDVERRGSPRADVVYEAIRDEGENELVRSSATPVAALGHAQVAGEAGKGA